MLSTVLRRYSGQAFLLLFAWSGLNAQTAALPAAFRSDTHMVLVPVTVTDHNGKTIEGLRAKNFNILEDQVPQPIVSFTAEDAPCSVGLVLDISGSMRNSLDAAKGVAQAFFEAANPQDEFLLLTVSTGGKAPGLAKLIREWLEKKLGLEWSDRLHELAQARARWRGEGQAPSNVSQQTRDFVQDREWLS